MYWYHKPTSLYNWPSIACPRSMWEMWRLLSRIQRFSGCNTMNFCVERAHSSWWFVWFVGWYTQEIWVVLVYSRLVCLQLVGKRCYIYIYYAISLCIMYTLFIIVHIMVHIMIRIMVVPIYPDAAQNTSLLSCGWRSIILLYLIFPSRGKLCQYIGKINTWWNGLFTLHSSESSQIYT